MWSKVAIHKCFVYNKFISYLSNKGEIVKYPVFPTLKEIDGNDLLKKICGIIIMMSSYCALFAIIFIICLFSPALYKNVSAKDTSSGSPRYHRCSDGIWRRPSNEVSYVRSRIYDNDLRLSVETQIKKSLAYPLYFSQYIKFSPHFQNIPDRQFRTALSDRQSAPQHESTASTALCYFTGDIMCLRGQQYAASVKKSFDFWPSYRLVARLFKNADFVCGNLETLLSPSNPLTKDRKTTESGTPLCNGPEELLRALRKAGYDMLVTANNHCCDYGTVGIIETKENLDKYLFANVGTSYPSDKKPSNSSTKNNNGGRFCIFDVNGISVAVFSYTHLINQRSLLSSEELDTMVNCYDHETVKKDISDARAAGAEFVVVYCHWGIENTEELTKYEIRDSEDIAEAGADLIIGSHPHCLQSCRYIETSDRRSVLCMYSMGNFCSSMTRDINNDTIILRVELERGNGDNSINSSISYIPCRVTSYRSRSFVVVPADPELNGGLKSSSLTEADERISAILNKTGDGSLSDF